MLLKEWEKAKPANTLEVCAAPMEAQTAINILVDEILGPNWNVSYSCNGQQANTEAVYAILAEVKKLKTPWYKKIFDVKA